jgi:hypothetical protein
LSRFGVDAMHGLEVICKRLHVCIKRASEGVVCHILPAPKGLKSIFIHFSLYDEGIKCNEAHLNACPDVTDDTRIKIYTYIDEVIHQGIVRFCGDKEMLKGE